MICEQIMAKMDVIINAYLACCRNASAARGLPSTFSRQTRMWRWPGRRKATGLSTPNAPSARRRHRDV